MSKTSPVYHPTATGSAAQLVVAHRDVSDLVLWAGWFCPFTQRVWIALEEKGLDYQYHEVNPYLKEESFLAISPKGLTPGFQANGKPLHDSSIINEFLDDRFPHLGPRLLPDGSYDKALCRLWIDHINKVVVPSFVRLLQAQPNDPEKQDGARGEFIASLVVISEHKRGQYFMGDHFSLVDAAIAPWVVRDFILRDFRGFRREDVSAQWQEWAHAIETRPSVVRTSSDADKYVEFNGTFLRNESHSLVGRAAQQHEAIQ